MHYELRDMKCPKCSEELKEGYLWLDIDLGSLYWSTIEPKSLKYQKESIEILRFNPLLWRGKENWLRRAYRCEKCGLIIFEEKYTLSSEEKKP